jgi:hypothetical protein
MERTKPRSRSPLIVPALVVLAALAAVYLPIRLGIAKSDRAREAPARGAAVSVFLTNQLAGYREPCG